MKSARDQIVENYEREIEEWSAELISGSITEEQYDTHLARLREMIKIDLEEVDKDR